MAKHTKRSEYKLHLVIITFSVLAGLALAACQPRKTDSSAWAKASPTSSSPTVSGAPQSTQESLDTEVNKALDEMESSLKTNNPEELNGADLK